MHRAIVAAITLSAFGFAPTAAAQPPTAAAHAATAAAHAATAAAHAATAAAQPPVAVAHSGWFWGDPRPQGEPLRNLRFAGQTGFAVGDFGTVLKTVDGGTTWSGEASGTYADLNQVWMTSANTVIVAGGCVLRRSDDGGRTFNRLPWTASDRLCSAQIARIDFPTGETGYLLLANGTVLRTSDGGQSWSRAGAVPGQPALSTLAFSNADVGLVAGNGIFRTTDAGRTWTDVDPGAFAVAGLSPTGHSSFLAISRFGGGSYTSADGGATWSSQRSSGAYGGVTSLVCGSATNCLLVTDLPAMFHTVDGGVTYHNVTPAPLTPTVPGWPALGTPVVVTTEGIPAVSVDAGASFTPVGVGLSAAFSDLHASANNSIASLRGFGGSLAVTHDGGRSWSTVDTPTTNALVDTYFLNDTLGFVLDSTGAVLRTEDGGGTWQTLAQIPSARSIVADTGLVIVAGAAGISVSHDNGQTFTKTSDAAVSQVIETSGGLIAVAPRTAYLSTSAGATWQQLPLPRGLLARESVRQLDFVTTRTGFVLGSAGDLFATNDGGRHWTELLGTGRSRLQSIAFTGARTGWAAEGATDGTAGALLRTDDGGLSWRPQRVSRVQINELAAGIQAGHGGLEGYALDSLGHLFATDTTGDLGAAEGITLRGPRRAKNHRVTVSGSLTPAQPGATIEISYRNVRGGGWTHKLVTASSAGKFTLTVRISTQTAFVARWGGDVSRRGAGSRAVIVSG